MVGYPCQKSKRVHATLIMLLFRPPHLTPKQSRITFAASCTRPTATSPEIHTAEGRRSRYISNDSPILTGQSCFSGQKCEERRVGEGQISVEEERKAEGREGPKNSFLLTGTAPLFSQKGPRVSCRSWPLHPRSMPMWLSRMASSWSWWATQGEL